MLKKDLPVNLLNSWTDNFKHHKELPFVTCSALVELDELQTFVDAAKEQQATAVRVYCIRFAINETVFLPPEGATGELPEGCRWVAAGNGLSQGSFALVPVDKISFDDDFVFSGTDVVRNNAVTALIPGIDRKGTGHCPPCETDKEPPPSDGR